LLDSIKQVLVYAKFLKDLYTKKKKLSVWELSLKKKKVSSILKSNTQPKYNDPMSSIISIIIGKCKVGKALLDSAASVNLLSYLVIKEIELGELKPTWMTL
jgi:GTP-sensing pleiotropic transcriptional regulator CodY